MDLRRVKKMKKALMVFAVGLYASMSFGYGLQSVVTPFEAADWAGGLVLQNDGFVETGSPAYLQLGFVTGEKAAIWTKVPQTIKYFKVDYFRVLIGDGEVPRSWGPATIFFQMDVGSLTKRVGGMIQNAASITSGPYWNDIPAQGVNDQLPCAKGGEYVGAALEFTHSGSPSVYRDHDGVANPAHNLLFAIPGDWNYSVAYGVTGDWILRIVGHEADPSECLN